MRGAVLYGPRDVRFEERETPKIVKPTDAIIRISATCVCGSDLWPYRGIQPIAQPTPMGHEYCGIVEEVGGAVTSIKPGQFVIGSFFASDNTCPNCQAGYPSSCQHREFVGGAQAPMLRVPLADGTLLATPDVPSADPISMGHEYCGIVEEVGGAVTSIKPGQFVIGSFFASDNTCPNCQAGYPSSCQHREFVGGAQAPMLRVPLADGTLLATPDVPSDD